MTFFWLAQAAPPSATQSILSMMPMILIFLIFYFIWFVPLRRKQKAHDQMIETLEKGQKVVTNGGIYGEISKVEGSTVLLKIADNTRIRISKRAIGGLQDAPEGGK